MSDERSYRIFTYGTLQLATVQLEKYGRLLSGESDSLPGYRVEPLKVDDPDVVRLSGKSQHPIARHTGDERDRIEGVVYLLTADELRTTDDYEVEPYVRVEVRLSSGRTAFAYVLSD